MKHKFIYRFYTKIKNQLIILKWKMKGSPLPPPHPVKQKTIIHYAKKFSLRTLIESGTYEGTMIQAMADHFDLIYSIELSKNLHDLARERFKNYGHIKLIQGDSGVEIGKIIPSLTTPTIFWLDGHFSSGITAKGVSSTPILEEINHILSSKISHVILVDDARLFGSEPDYPTINYLKELMHSYDIDVINDIIIATPKMY